jgi:acyl-coenzyme A synthetase/AMP-(fatty) acid ligase
LTGDTLPSDEDLELFVGERLARHKVPREWMAIEALPVNAAGKVQKFILRDLYEQGRSG